MRRVRTRDFTVDVLVGIYIFSLIQSNRSQIIVKNEIPRKSEMTPPS